MPALAAEGVDLPPHGRGGDAAPGGGHRCPLGPATGARVQRVHGVTHVHLSPVPAAEHVERPADDGPAHVVTGLRQLRQLLPPAGHHVVRRHGGHRVLQSARARHEHAHAAREEDLPPVDAHRGAPPLEAPGHGRQPPPPVGARGVDEAVAQGLPLRAPGQPAEDVDPAVDDRHIGMVHRHGQRCRRRPCVAAGVVDVDPSGGGDAPGPVGDDAADHVDVVADGGDAVLLAGAARDRRQRAPSPAVGTRLRRWAAGVGGVVGVRVGRDRRGDR